MVRFIARCRIGAREWGKQEAIRLKLVEGVEEMKRRRRRVTGGVALVA
jgi:hypothetical protein